MRIPGLRTPLAALAGLVLLTACKPGDPEALGTLEWDRVNGRAVASETITRLHVAEGDAVTSGQPLLELDSTLQQARVKRAQAQMESARWKLSELQAGYRTEEIAAAQALYDAAVSTRENRERELVRQQELVKNQLTSERNADTAKTRLDQALGEEEAAYENLLQLQAGYRTEEIASAEAEFEAATEQLTYEQQLLERYTILAERDGILESFPFKLGDKPPAGAVVTTVLSGEAPWARVYLPQPYLASASVGTEVDVWVDGLDAPLKGRIRHIESRPSFTPYYALAEEDRQRLSYVAQVDLPDGRATELPVGIPVRVDLAGAR